ncbi:hypothetical protein CEXT_282321 [Caerostris extrusa]|uniref:Uncharacterized protein n=1 Tax=Caerostris extrusa TaxID=172846 RepID=A0AAV4Y867_CAEEX|nr:hypothetical protein CEXT_282321 [Caerostris extrusa]
MSCGIATASKVLCYLNALMALAMMKGSSEWPFKNTPSRSQSKFKRRRKLSTSNDSNGRKDINIYSGDLFEGERTDFASAG